LQENGLCGAWGARVNHVCIYHDFAVGGGNGNLTGARGGDLLRCRYPITRRTNEPQLNHDAEYYEGIRYVRLVARGRDDNSTKTVENADTSSHELRPAEEHVARSANLFHGRDCGKAQFPVEQDCGSGTI
jgi:hypothetical protein